MTKEKTTRDLRRVREHLQAADELAKQVDPYLTRNWRQELHTLIDDLEFLEAVHDQ